MTAQAVPERGKRDQTQGRTRARAIFTLPFVFAVALVGAVAVFVSYVLWPTWPSTPTPLDAPAIPITVAGVLFDVPPASIREAVQRHPGQHERVDLAFEWPSLSPPHPDNKPADKAPLNVDNAIAAAAETAKERLFVTIAGLGAELPPLERLRNIYPRYIEAQAAPALTGSPSCRSAPARLTKPRTWSIAAATPSSFSPAAPGPSGPCPAHASGNWRSTRPRSRSASRATGSRIGATSRPASIGSPRSSIRPRSNAGRPDQAASGFFGMMLYSRSVARIAIWKL